MAVSAGRERGALVLTAEAERPTVAREMLTLGATPVVVAVKLAVLVSPRPSSALIVTDWLDGSSVAGCVHDQVPALVPLWVTLPAEAVRETVSPSGSEKLPVIVGALPSSALAVGLSGGTIRARLGGAAL